jgi:tetratricopeptide (TPR) repeat protein
MSKKYKPQEPKIAPKPVAQQMAKPANIIAEKISEVKDVIKDTLPFEFHKVNNIILAGLIGLISFFVFRNSLENTFVLDDHGIIKSNKVTKGGLSKANVHRIFTKSLRDGDVSDLEHSLYRPMVKVIFAWLWEKSGGGPENYKTFHQFNVMAYALMCIVLYFVMLGVFRNNWMLAFLATLLFTVHPMHSEVVANNKSLDEILGLLGPLVAILCAAFVCRTENMMFKILGTVLIIASYLFGLLSKESAALVFPLIPLYAYFFNDAKLKDLILITVGVLIAALIWYKLRNDAIGWFLKLQSSKPDPSALDNVLALCKEDQTKKGGFLFGTSLATVLFIMGRYAATLFYPDPLSCDYSFATIQPMSFTGHPKIAGFTYETEAWPVWLSLFFYGFIIYYAVKTFLKKDAIGFGIIWFIITCFIASNITVLIGYIIGTSFGDRMMFTPSVGWAVAVVGGLYYAFKYFKKNFDVNKITSGISAYPILTGIVVLVSAYFGKLAIARNADWKRDYTLFAKDVENFPNSTHLLFYWGNHLSSNEYLEGKGEAAKQEYSKKALETFRRSMSLYPALPSDGYNQYGKCYYNLGNIDSAEKYYLKAHKEDTTNAVFMNNVGTIYFQRANNLKRVDFYDSAHKYFSKAYSKDSTVVDYQNNLGAVLGTVQKFDDAIRWFTQAYRTDSLSEGAILSCRSNAVTYKTLQNAQLEQFWMQKAAEIQAYRNQKLAERGY